VDGYSSAAGQLQDRESLPAKDQCSTTVPRHQPIAIDRIAWSVCLSVCHIREPRKNGSTDRDTIWMVDSGGPKDPCVRWGQHLPWEWAILWVVWPTEKHCKALLG